MTRKEAKLHLYELWQNGIIPNNFDENHSDYNNALEFTIKNKGFDYDEFTSINAIIRFGVWQVESDALVGKVGYDYKINDRRFWETEDYNGHLVWSWLIHLAEKIWIDKENVKNLNIAFFFCQDYFKEHKPKDLPYVSTAQTLNIQKQILEIREEMSKREKLNKQGLVEIETEDIIKYSELLSDIKYI